MARELSIEKERSIQSYIEKHMYYDYDRQDVVWKNLKRTAKLKRNDNSVGDIHTVGGYQYRMVGFNEGKRHTCMLVNRIAWFLVTGEWPNGGLLHKNKNPADVSIKNLVLMSPRTLHILQRLKNDIEFGRINPKKVGNGRWSALWYCHENKKITKKQKRFDNFQDAYDRLLEEKTYRISALESQGIELSEVIERLTTHETTGDHL